MVRIVGDVHGKWSAYKNIVHDVESSIQVGDFGVGFHGPYFTADIDSFQSNDNHRFIRGNHDSPGAAKTMKMWIPDGTYENGVMYIGGAWSIDRYMRTPGYDWWYDEENSTEAFDSFYETYTEKKPTVMITHDAPHNVVTELFFEFGPLGGRQHETRTGTELQRLFEAHKPDLWIFGHWHISARSKILGTEFYCLNELEYIDVDL